MRWPLHPTIIPGERLSSWLRRVGILYGLKVEDLLKGLGFAELKPSQLDVRVPKSLIGAITERTGMTATAVLTSTLSGILPSFLLKDLRTTSAEDPSLSVLWKPAKYRQKHEPRRIKWIRREGNNRLSACRFCLADYPNTGVMLSWRLAVIFSCPTHGVLLEPAEIKANRVIWSNAHSEQAPELVSMLDMRTWSALMNGYVRLPGDIISTDQWFRILQRLFQELELPTAAQEVRQWQQMVWDLAGYSPRSFGQQFRFDIRCGKLIAIAIDQMERGCIFPHGTEGHLFLNRK